MQSQQTLELRQRQQLALTPALQQSIRFLQLSSLELKQELAQAILENPMLESEAEYDTDEGLSVEGEVPSLTADLGSSGRSRSNPDNDGDDDGGPQFAAPETLQDHLLQQLSVARAGSRDEALVRVLVHELNQDGYLGTPLSDIVAFLQQHAPVDEADISSALNVLQSFEPAGVGARTLSECLTLQLERVRCRAPDGEARADVFACAMTVASQHLDLLATGNLGRVRQAIGCTDAILKAAHALILSLDPRPARDWATNVASYVIPDVLVRKVGYRWRATLNMATVPRVRVHALYSELLAKSGESGGLRGQLQQAQGLVKGLNHRYDTILRVSQAIVDHQQDYFEHGAKAMRPLILRDIAHELDVHESTVSRATRSKYAQTPHGVIELKDFFGSTLDTRDGESTSASAVQFMIARLVENEPQAKPLSDNKIAQQLEQQGVKIARRTVAKYREEAGIEPAIRRKARYTLKA